MKRVLQLLLLSILICVHAHGENLSSAWKIILPKQPHVTEAYAAEELQHYLKLMTGQQLDILHAGEGPVEKAFVIGTPESMKAIRRHSKALKLNVKTDQDRLAVKTLGNRVFLAGNAPAGALYAVYTFLTDVCGIQWLWQGESGEFVPRKQLAMGDWDITWESSFKYRGFHICATDKCSDAEMETWMARHRLNIIRAGKKLKGNVKELKKKGFHVMFSNHNVAARYVTNPEWYALRNGKRDRHQVCWSKPEVVDFFVKKFVQECREYPEVEIYQMFPDDNRLYCECPECSKLSRTDGWFNLLNRLIDGMHRLCPTLKFSTIAYQGYKVPPKNVDLSRLEMVEFCQYDRCFAHEFDKCAVNKHALKNLEEWRQKDVPVGIYGYEFDVFSSKNLKNPVPFYNYSLLADQMRRYRDLGMVSILPEVISGNTYLKSRPSFVDARRLAYYVYATALCNPDADLKQTMRTFCQTLYGKAAPQMLKFYQLMDRAWGSMKVHPSHYGANPQGYGARLLNRNIIAKATKLFAQANQAVSTMADPAERKRIARELATEKALFETWHGIYKQDLLSQKTAIIPRNRKPWNFKGAFHTEDFGANDPKKPGYPTEMWMNYDDEAIYVKLVCKDPSIKNLQAQGRERDTWFWKGDESIHLFFSAPGDQADSTYRQFSVNPLGAIYDCTDCNGNRKDAWNPTWEAKADIKADRYVIQVRLPFTVFGKDRKLDGRWTFSAARSSNKLRAGVGAVVYPSGNAYYQPDNFVTMKFSPRKDVPSVAFFSRPPDCLNPGVVTTMGNELQKAGYQAVATDDEAVFQQTLKQSQDIIVICHPNSSFKMSFYQETILPALEKGAIVIFSSYHPLPIHRYLKDPQLDLSWSGWEIASPRKTIQLNEAKWMRGPHDLVPLFKNCKSPSSAYAPKHPEAWNIIGTLPMQDGRELPYMMTKKVGKGFLMVTSADMVGWNQGTHLLCGHTHVIQLLDNLLAYRRRK